MAVKDRPVQNDPTREKEDWRFKDRHRCGRRGRGGGITLREPRSARVHAQNQGRRLRLFRHRGQTDSRRAAVTANKRLAIPPAYTDVWICPSANGHIQATGRDARGRKQYRYHERWRAARDENKYDRMVLFGEALPKIRKRVEADLALPGLRQNKVLATVVQLLQRTFIRVGNEEYARDNKSFGLTTMKGRHVDVNGSKLRFRFQGKSGIQHDVDIQDRRIAKIVAKVQDLPGQNLFQYLDDDGEARDITSQDVNDYLREITGEDFTAKDIRTWAGTVLAAIALNAAGAFETKKQAKANIKNAIGAVAKILGNTPAICQKCYIDPVVLESYLDGDIIEDLKRKTDEALESEAVDLRASEVAILKFLQAKLAKKAA